MTSTILSDGHQYEVSDETDRGYGGKTVVCDLAPPLGFGQAAEAGAALLGRSKELKRITYKGVVKMGLSGVIVSQDTAAAVASVTAAETGKGRRNIQLEE